MAKVNEMLDELVAEMEKEILVPTLVAQLETKVKQGQSQEYYKGMMDGMMAWEVIMSAEGREDLKRAAQGAFGLYVNKLAREAGESECWPKEVELGGGE